MLVSIVFFILPLFVALLGMLWATIAVILDFDTKADIMDYAGYTNEKDKPKLIGLIISGIIGIGVIITILGGVFNFLWQAVSLDKQNKPTKERHIRKHFNVAIEHLSNKNNVSVRIDSFNEFYHIAEIEPDWRKTIFDILFPHLQQITKHKNYKNNIKPTEEVQSLLDILFKPKNKAILIFSGLDANLAEANLQGANLQEAHLRDAKMQDANLRDANLQGANLQGADLQDAKMQDAKMQEANLQDANLRDANLQGANLQGADLQDACLQDANLQDAKMQHANLQKANLRDADLRYAHLRNANLQDANLQDAKMRDANLRDANLRDANLRDANLQYVSLQEANLQKANLQDTNLQDAHLQGANLQDADLQYAKMQYAKMQDANLQGTDLQGADLRDANLRYANLRYANLQRADLQGAQINRETTVMPDNWTDVVKLYDNKKGQKRPLVVVVTEEGNKMLY